MWLHKQIARSQYTWTVFKKNNGNSLEMCSSAEKGYAPKENLLSAILF